MANNGGRTALPLRGEQASESQAVASSSPLGLIALHLLEQLERSQQNGVIFISEDERRAEQLGAILAAFAPDSGVMVLPRFDTLPYDGLEPSPDVSGRRASVLRRLAQRRRPPLLIGTAESFIQRVPPSTAWENASFHLHKGRQVEQDDLRNFFARAGYSLEPRIDAPGSALLQDQVLEIFPAGALGPIRLRFVNEKVASIHPYSLEDQREEGELDELTLDPVSEWAEIVRQDFEHRDANPNIFQYAAGATLIADHGITSRAQSWLELIEETRTEAIERSPEEKFLSRTEWESHLSGQQVSMLAKTSNAADIPSFSTMAAPSKSFRGFLDENQRLGCRIVFTAATDADLRTMDRRAGAVSERCAGWFDASSREGAKRTSLIVDLDRGFIRRGHNSVLVVTARDLLGSRAAHHNAFPPVANSTVEEPSDLRIGDVVVHLDRGFCIIRGLETVSASEMPDTEMVRLEFANGQIVMIPTEELGEVWRYSSDPLGVSLDKADASSWQTRRLEFERDIAETAASLSQLVAERQKRTAPKIMPPMAEYERFAARFPYLPSPDQSKAIEQVLQDLASGHPMDRLVCGDVGYGKTEVALRAAAAVVFAGKQVAVAAPTTVLARQHLQTFRKRFSPFSMEVGQLSRFATAAEVRTVRKALAAGSQRIVIGTHALVSKDVHFADLGLLVVDEEQRFGAAQKTKLAELGKDVHLLTLTATPIPRTLSQITAGIRSFSTISTPPIRRIPVKTIAEPFNADDVSAALRRERRRRGQSFVVCPRIEDIDPMRDRLNAIAPELSVCKVHGRMPAREIDEQMLNFANGKVDILLTTNIIENGLDLPRANTIIIWRPDRFGLAQLHQLRGRVGRSGVRAFAYLLSDPDSAASPDASARLEVLLQGNRGGAGLEISQKDMELRGSGDMLSERQSGHVKALGPALYRHLLQRAMSELHGHRRPDGGRPQLRLDVSRLLPKEYIENEEARLQIYARISKAEIEADLDAIVDELEVRFGELPIEAGNLIASARIEIDCRRLDIVQIDAGPAGVAATLSGGRRPSLLLKMRSVRNRLTWKEGRILYQRRSELAGRLLAVREFVDILESCTSGAPIQ